MTLDFVVDKLEASDSLDGVVITDHTFAIYFPPDVAWARAYMSDSSVFDAHKDFGAERLESYLASIEALRGKGPRVGLETEIMCDGRFTFDPAYRERLDVLIGSVHFLPFEVNAGKLEIFDMWRKNTSELINSGIDVLGHPFRFIANHIAVSEEVIADVVDEAVSAGVALELNSHCEVDADSMMLRKLAEKGGKLAFSTDAHRRDEFGVFTHHEKKMSAAGTTMADFKIFPEPSLMWEVSRGESSKQPVSIGGSL
ncbi:MAG: hypothetical protein GXP32_02050 [Kiritimatiellaeota bacterium]|nr:hypothetical protein [Kiritimatiellota bacterium]